MAKHLGGRVEQGLGKDDSNYKLIFERTGRGGDREKVDVEVHVRLGCVEAGVGKMDIIFTREEFETQLARHVQDRLEGYGQGIPLSPRPMQYNGGDHGPSAANNPHALDGYKGGYA